MSNNKIVYEHYANILDAFYENILKAMIIGTVERTNLPEKQFHKSVLDEVENLEKKYGIASIASSQSIIILISAMEAYLRDSFILLVNNDERLKEKLLKTDKKIELSKVYELQNSMCTFGDILADQYNFQNLDSIHLAYDWLLNINVFDGLNGIKKLSGKHKSTCPGCGYDIKFSKIDKPIELMRALLELRHKIVHKSFTDKTAATMTNTYLDLIQLFVSYINFHIKKHLKK